MGPGCQKEAGKLRILRGTWRGRPPAPGPAPPPGPCCVSTTAKSLSSSDLLSTLSCTTTRDPGSSLKSWAPGCCWPAPGAAILVVGGWRVLGWRWTTDLWSVRPAQPCSLLTAHCHCRPLLLLLVTSLASSYCLASPPLLLLLVVVVVAAVLLLLCLCCCRHPSLS